MCCYQKTNQTKTHFSKIRHSSLKENEVESLIFLDFQLGIFVCLFILTCSWQVEVPRPGIEPMPGNPCQSSDPRS